MPMCQPVIANEVGESEIQQAYSSQKATLQDPIFQDYEFLSSLIMDDALLDQQKEWQFSIELNNTGDDEAAYRQIFSLSKMQLLLMEDQLSAEVETDSFDHYKSLSWFYDTGPVASLDALGLGAIEWEGSYAHNRLDDDITDEQLIKAMLEHPILVNRPIVCSPKGVKLCRPSESVLDILDQWPQGPYFKEDGEKILDDRGRKL